MAVTVNGSPIRVAIVDDDEGFLAALEALLELEPELEVVGTATVVSDALALIDDADVELVLVDVRMPDGGGLEVLEAARRLRRPPWISLISAEAPDAAVIASGAEFIAKHELGTDRILEIARSVRAS